MNTASLPSKEIRSPAVLSHESKEMEANYEREAYRELTKDNIDYGMLYTDMTNTNATDVRSISVAQQLCHTEIYRWQAI
ncbi:MAG: hypothetical protein IJ428_03780 [Clostridia bacterium]|nr:hypothetical protein [Clostridia bacterium]